MLFYIFSLCFLLPPILCSFQSFAFSFATEHNHPQSSAKFNTKITTIFAKLFNRILTEEIENATGHPFAGVSARQSLRNQQFKQRSNQAPNQPTDRPMNQQTN